MIASPKTLYQLADRVRNAAWVAIDTEADSRHCYFEKICLLQVSHPDGDELVDTLAGLDLSPLLASLNGKTLMLHGADYDLRLLRRTYEFVPAAIFDTDVAARLVGIPQTGLGSLVERFFGIHMEKASQKADWARRPLTENMLAYAVADTHHLKPLVDILRAELERLGRLEWMEQSCADVIRRSAITRERDPYTEWRVTGASKLSRHGLAVLREVWTWRDREAQAVDRPPFHILMNERLVMIAAAAADGKPIVPLIPQRMPTARRQRLLDAVHHGLKIGPESLPVIPRGQRQRTTRVQLKHLEELKAVRDAKALALGIEPSLIASRATLEALAQDRAANIGRLLPWQRELLGLN